MAQAQRLIETLKRQLKNQGWTYAKVAEALGLSESSVKRLFSRQEMSLSRLEQLCGLIHLEVSDLARLAAQQETLVKQLSVAQEAELVSDEGLLLVAVCVTNHLDYATIRDTYAFTDAELTRYLIKLDRLELIDLLPENRIRLKIDKNFTWQANGPIRAFLHERLQNDFLRSRFNGPGETLWFAHGMLTPEANAQLQERLRRVVQEFYDLHKQDIDEPLTKRFGSSLLIAFRPWEPAVFEALRRKADTRVFPA